MNKSSSSKKQHYIPQFYLKNFSQDRKIIYIYDRDRGTKGEIRHQTTVNIAHENNFYTHLTKSNERQDLEDLFNLHESKAAKIIPRIHKNQKITDKDKGYLTWFIAFLYTRTPAFKYRTDETAKKLTKEAIKRNLSLTPNEYMKEFYEKEGVQITDEEIDDLKDFALDQRRSKLEVDVPKEHWIKMMLDMAMEVLPVFYSMDWTFVNTKKKYAFITSDNPFLIAPPNKIDRFRGYGLITPGTRKIIPLMSDFCLVMYDVQEKPQIAFTTAAKNFFREVNKMLIANAERFSFSSHKAKLEKLVKDVKPYEIEKRDRIIVG